ncbi:MAG: glycosyltransferase family 2 protein [Candidatus Electrothrix sp. YB6]
MDITDIIVPVFNEQDGLHEFHRRVTALGPEYRLIFIDNASTDNSLEIIENFKEVTIIRHETNQGYGASLRDGIRAARAGKIIIIDADCEYPPEAIPLLVQELDRHEVVYTSRFLDDRNRDRMGYMKMLGNKIISGAFNLLFRQQVTDLYTGSKGFRRQVVSGLPMERNGFEHVLEVAARLAKKGITIHEIPVDFRPRQTGQSKMRHLGETVKYLGLLIWYAVTIPASEKKT